MKSKNEKKGFALLMEWAGSNKFLIYRSVLFALFSSVCNIAPYYIFYRIIDSAVDGSLTIRYGADLAWLLIVFTAIRVICNAFASLSSHKGAYNTLFKVRCMVTEHMAKMPMGALNERSVGEIKCVMNESIEKLELFLAHNLPELALYLFGPVVMFGWLFTVNHKLALLSILPLVFVIIVMVLMFARFFKFMDRINASVGEPSGTVSEYVNGMRNIVFGSCRRMAVCSWTYHCGSTSSLDIENELLVKKAVLNLLTLGKTVVMIAHTLPIIQSADKITVIKDGKVEECGTHDELINKNGKYASMWKASLQVK